MMFPHTLLHKPRPTLTAAEMARLTTWLPAFTHLRQTIDWPSPLDAKRLMFTRWLYRTGRISDDC